MSEKNILEFDNQSLVPLLFGEHNSHLKYLEEKLGVSIADRGNQLSFSGDKNAVKAAQSILDSLWNKLKHNQEHIERADIDAALRFLDAGKALPHAKPRKSAQARLSIKTKKKTIAPRSPGQSRYMRAILENDMVFGIGPAGTGKTYLAVAAAVSLYLEGKVERLIFTRPAVEAGENLGFLPGDMKEKVDPYLRPIYDALQDMLDWDYLMKKIEAGEIEIAPLAFMRGRTLSNAFVILDEAQNTTCSQMKMFLTRMGENTHMVVTGDITQTDLPKSVKSGLKDAKETLESVDDINFSYLSTDDVVRHALVGKIIKAYDTHKK